MSKDFLQKTFEFSVNLLDLSLIQNLTIMFDLVSRPTTRQLNERLESAVRWNRTMRARSALCKGAHPDAPTTSGEPLLCMAARLGNRGIAAALTLYGAKIDTRNAAGATPLILAAQQGHTRIVELLLKRGASISAKDSADRTALDYAQAKKYTDIEMLLEKAKPHVPAWVSGKPAAVFNGKAVKPDEIPVFDKPLQLKLKSPKRGRLSAFANHLQNR
jgi:ankyrin repeat protein